MILVTGAAGKTGLAVLTALRRRGAVARAYVRRAEQAAAVRAAGASEVVTGDLADPEAVARAFRGARAVYHICPNVSPREVEIGRLMISAARRAGVERFVFHSVLHPQTEAMPHHWRKLRVEEHLLESGVPLTILQPAAYLQNLLAQRDQILGAGVLEVPYAVTTRIALVDLEDVAAVAARVLTEAGHLGAVYELCGVPALDQEALAAELSRVLGRSVQAVAVPIDVWRARARSAGLDPERCQTLIAMFRYYERFGFEGNPNVLGWLLERCPTGCEPFLEREFGPATRS